MATKAQKKIPQRMCCGCKEKMTKQELIRVVKDPQGGVCLDITGKMNGRGAYICPRMECFKMARKGRRLERALETAIPDEVYTAMEEELSRVES